MCLEYASLESRLIMNKFIVKPNRSVKEIIEAKKLQEVLKPSDDSGDRFRWELNPVDVHTSQFNSDIKNEDVRWWPNCSAMINPAEMR